MRNLNNWFLLILASGMLLATGCASTGKAPAAPAGLTAEQVASIIDKKLGQYQEQVKAKSVPVEDESVDMIVDRLKASNFNHPAIAVKREVRGCVIQMVLYADTDVDRATDACMKIYNRKAPRSDAVMVNSH